MQYQKRVHLAETVAVKASGQNLRLFMDQYQKCSRPVFGLKLDEGVTSHMKQTVLLLVSVE